MAGRTKRFETVPKGFHTVTSHLAIKGAAPPWKCSSRVDLGKSEQAKSLAAS